MFRPTKHMNQMAERYGVEIAWAEGSSRTINIRTSSMVTFHRIVTEMAWDHELNDAAMVMVRDNAA